ncbi:MAG: helix-turn-helix domain-containing protein [Reyranella sp.]|nr:helix-turn-helix domain-containing protein [Reyranella sp.]
MAPSDREIFFGQGARRPPYPSQPFPQPPAGQSMSFTEAYALKKSYRQNAVLPPDMSGYTLEDLRVKAEEETRPEREAKERAESARRLESAATAVQRALSGGAAEGPRKRVGWRLRVTFLGNLARGRSIAEAAARTGIDETTARRWRKKFPAFDAKWTEILEGRARCGREDFVLRAGEPRVTQRYFFRGRQVGELVRHDDRALMFLMQRAERAKEREEDRAERREIREHELAMRRLEIEAKKGIPEKPESTGQAASPEKA